MWLSPYQVAHGVALAENIAATLPRLRAAPLPPPAAAAAAEVRSLALERPCTVLCSPFTQPHACTGRAAGTASRLQVLPAFNLPHHSLHLKPSDQPADLVYICHGLIVALRCAGGQGGCARSRLDAGHHEATAAPAYLRRGPTGHCPLHGALADSSTQMVHEATLQ